jgi:hypothetical protein
MLNQVAAPGDPALKGGAWVAETSVLLALTHADAT